MRKAQDIKVYKSQSTITHIALSNKLTRIQGTSSCKDLTRLGQIHNLIDKQLISHHRILTTKKSAIDHQFLNFFRPSTHSHPQISALLQSTWILSLNSAPIFNQSYSIDNLPNSKVTTVSKQPLSMKMEFNSFQSSSIHISRIKKIFLDFVDAREKESSLIPQKKPHFADTF
jgi:hypothetical protein